MEVNDKIVFKYNGIELQYKVIHIGKYWLSNTTTGTNTAIFNLLKIEDRFAFCAKEVGYDFAMKTLDFPELDTLQDLEKVVDALYQRIIEISTPKFKVGDLVMVGRREGESSDYVCNYNDEMVQYEYRIFAISKIHKMLISSVKSSISRLRYEEPFYYTLEGNIWNWTSDMLHKVGTIKDSIKGVTSLDKVILTDIGEVGVSSYMDAHTTAITCDKITCDKTIDGPSLYPEKEEPEYKLNFHIKPLKFY